ncbi:MAG: phenylacetic acid degradation protein PaaY [Gammaproteobacteria bacterium]
MAIYKLGDHIPVVDPQAYVHPTAVLIGDVIVGAGVYVGPCAVLRGDFGRIQLDTGSNLQDTCVMHAFPDKDCVVKTNGHIGHGAILHGCVVGENALIGMNSVVMDDACVAAESIVAACSFVPAGFTCPERSLVMGTPAKVKRSLSEDEVKWKTQGTGEYQSLTRRSIQELTEVEALTSVQPNRPRVRVSDYAPKK